jgi:hypothetical protein
MKSPLSFPSEQQHMQIGIKQNDGGNVPMSLPNPHPIAELIVGFSAK